MSLWIVLYLVVLIEGYSVLALELIAIRQLTPFVGSGVETVAILVAAVLMPLAFGYYQGGNHRYRLSTKGSLSYRNKLIRNLMQATAILVIGFSHICLELFFSYLGKIGITSAIGQTALYALIFIVYPVYLLGQTVPLISNYFARGKISEVTGHMLFFSTLGSFLGSIFSTLILMVTIGVHYTVFVTISLLAILIIVLDKSFFSARTFYAIFICCIALLFNNHSILEKFHIVSNNNYSMVQIENVPGESEAKIMKINRSLSSKYTPELKKRFLYVQYIDYTFLRPYKLHDKKRDILVIGSGGFTLGLEDPYNNYTFVDIDKSLQKVSETYLLPEPLGKNKTFIGQPARLFMQQNTKQYDIIVVDAYTNIYTIPPQLLTQEFFLQLKQSLKPQGVMVMNAATQPDFSTVYSRKLHSTLQSVFPYLTRQVLQKHRADNSSQLSNVMYSYTKHPFIEGHYSDNKNTYFLDQ